MREGWVLVPREPTEAMKVAGENVAVANFIPAGDYEAMIYRAMLAALPTEPLGGEG
jgi:hypothetical protein